jgi:hypothetical protein
MGPYEPGFVFDFRPLDDSSRALLGYFVHTWFHHYLSLITKNLHRLHELGLIEGLDEPTEAGRYSLLFDFNALDLEHLTYINGIYFYILAAHKGANRHLMNRFDGKQILFLRGYDYQSSWLWAPEWAMASSSWHTFSFTYELADLLREHGRLIKVMSPEDVYRETASAQRYFYTDFDHMIPMSNSRYVSLFFNASHWKDDSARLFRSVDHYIVYVSSITDSLMWELDQLDSNLRRDRVTVVLDEDAIHNKEFQLNFRDWMSAEYGDRLIWSKPGSPPAQTVDELKAELAQSFVVVTRDEFEQDIDTHRRRISLSTAELGPGERETWFDFRFFPSVDEATLQGIRDSARWVNDRLMDWMGDRGVDSLPVFLNLIQLRVFVTLLLGDHFETGRALAAYAAVMQGAYDYYAAADVKVAPLSDDGRQRSLETLTHHHDQARHIGWYFLSIGRSHEFDDFRRIADREWDAVFDRTKAAVDSFFAEVLSLHGYRSQ